ncbi:MAG: hypothetical protein ABI377_10930 [Devosia sp.]
MHGNEERILARTDHLMRQPAPEEAEFEGAQCQVVTVHSIGDVAAKDEIHFHLGVPMRLVHQTRALVDDNQIIRLALDNALGGVAKKL